MLNDAFIFTREGCLPTLARGMRTILAILCFGLPFNGSLRLIGK